MRHLISLEAVAVVAQLRQRGDESVALFSRLRDRGPLLAATQSRLSELAFEHLVLLEPIEQKAVLVFCQALERCRWYVQYTEDMPLKVKTGLGALSAELEARLLTLTQTIGMPDADGAPVVQAAKLTPKRLKRRKTG